MFGFDSGDTDFKMWYHQVFVSFHDAGLPDSVCFLTNEPIGLMLFWRFNQSIYFFAISQYMPVLVFVVKLCHGMGQIICIP